MKDILGIEHEPSEIKSVIEIKDGLMFGSTFKKGGKIVRKE